MLPVVDGRQAERCLIANAALFSVGHALTAGGVLSYFASELGARTVEFTWLLTLPELAATAGVLTRPLVRFRNRRTVWRAGAVLSVLCLSGIPLLALLPQLFTVSRVSVLLGIIGLSSATRGIAFVTLLSWMADVVDQERWGRFFAVRNVAQLLVTLFLTPAVGMAHDALKKSGPPGSLTWVYATTFLTGVVALAGSTLVLWNLPDRSTSSGSSRPPDVGELTSGGLSGRVLALILFSWWHAAFSGLTQVVFLQFRIKHLAIGLGTFYLLEALMRLVQIPVCQLSGWLGDRVGHRPVLVAGVVVAGSSLICWLRATPEEWWWICPAYVLFGGWGAINVAGPNLLLAETPRESNTTAIALYQNVSGALAGLSGLAGGYWLAHLLAHAPTGQTLSCYRTLFVVSMAGRVSAVLFLANPGVRRNASVPLHRFPAAEPNWPRR